MGYIDTEILYFLTGRYTFREVYNAQIKFHMRNIFSTYSEINSKFRERDYRGNIIELLLI